VFDSATDTTQPRGKQFWGELHPQVILNLDNRLI